ncbi:MAG: hypothetical protein ACFE7A_01650, partial [Promethearchaeota archaeon]
IISKHKKDYFKADYEYYKDKSDIPYDGKISTVKKKLAYVQAGKMLNDFMVKNIYKIIVVKSLILIRMSFRP